MLNNFKKGLQPCVYSVLNYLEVKTKLTNILIDQYDMYNYIRKKYNALMIDGEFSKDQIESFKPLYIIPFVGGRCDVHVYLCNSKGDKIIDTDPEGHYYKVYHTIMIISKKSLF